MHNLRTEIEERFGSVHKFCRLHPSLNRATVYQVLAGKYGGNIQRQLQRICDVLEENSDERRVMEAIKATACARCNVTSECHRCDKLFQEQAKAVTRLFSN
tara:strand:- start:12550 stop:12852 length:303 start_codon:yes stop_codon:yes gene_type:complete